ncbi:ATP-grasp domain-containing protein [Methylobacillus caricis]|uniref:ATP-grasp domain-containing protein n=1 Tax=Methylobacillus caricis TaxID=1971611 RepID=UPI001CFFFBFC|nr:ATP-grasp domain-containing protein [Methylobacillus caricis]MCB5187285.1 ATP-grasp domain-containing protein [Methylobacillus caricis]
MKVFVCEYITSGGLYREPLPASLAQEALLMRDAILRDLSGIENLEIMVVSDPRLPLPAMTVALHTLESKQDPWPVWQQVMSEADIVWPVAPESRGELYRLSLMIESAGLPSLASPAASVRIAASKYATFLTLDAAHVPVVDSHRFPSLPENAQAWVAKPDDGVGCEDSHYFEHQEQLLEWLRQGHMSSHIIQPYIAGIPASISMLCKEGKAWLLSCNQQQVALKDGSFYYAGSILNGLSEYWQLFAELATQVAQAMPQLFGYVGVDVMIRHDQTIQVLEVNPRLTTSYAGLQAAIGYNPARLILDLLYNDDFKLPQDLQRNRVEIKLNV